MFEFGGSAIGTRIDTDSVSQHVSTDIRQLQRSPYVYFFVPETIILIKQ
jgi:hypothetical protein